VDVRGGEIRGRIFVTKNGIGLATTSDDEGLLRHLAKSGLVDDTHLSELESGSAGLGPIVEKSGGAVVDLIREMTVESLYQLGLHGDTFEVEEGAKSHYVSPKAFELEELLTDSKQRLTDWIEVSRIVDDLEAPIAFVRDLGEREEVTIDSESWKVLSEVGSGASVSEMADELGTTEFWTARIASRLIDIDLVAFTPEETPAAAPVIAESPEVPAAGQAQSDRVVDEDVDPDESWWEEPEADSEEAIADDDNVDAEVSATPRTLQDMLVDVKGQDETEPVAVAEEVAEDEVAEEVAEDEVAASQIPTVAADSDTGEVEEDTEAFLEKVFSELETPEDEPKEEGYGLLRRRRMGAIRDHSSDA
jgi:hypothetical protein